jgi:hypothetical protein
MVSYGMATKSKAKLKETSEEIRNNPLLKKTGEDGKYEYFAEIWSSE